MRNKSLGNMIMFPFGNLTGTLISDELIIFSFSGFKSSKNSLGLRYSRSLEFDIVRKLLNESVMSGPK